MLDSVLLPVSTRYGQKGVRNHDSFKAVAEYIEKALCEGRFVFISDPKRELSVPKL